MKTTLDIQDDLLLHAKLLAKRTGRPLRSLVEEGLQLVVANETTHTRYELPDCAVGDPGADDPLESLSWQDLRSVIYGESMSQ